MPTVNVVVESLRPSGLGCTAEVLRRGWRADQVHTPDALEINAFDSSDSKKER